ncbi:MAG TPA: methyltransferase C-terminal domain-containing protein, partial [Candidatus Nanoarchaeia archaeon]|nr:methyltransferase C-terminal domain-containing protein [Candidatus Nanoarchaeia archaeon]
FARHGLELFDVKKFTIHGGSIRVYAKKVTNRSIKADHEALQWLLELEHDLGLYDAKTYRGFARDVERLKRDLLVLLTKLRQQGKSIAAYGASAKGNVLTNYCGIGREIIHYVVDDTPEKQGYLTPGNHIPIVSMQRLRTEKPDYLLLLAWNFAEELMEKTEEYRKAGGKYIIPIPNVRVV